jgi:1-deoxy-D-xylulose-5-phosphate synthase
VEDGSIAGGFGSAILEFMAAHHYQAEVIMLGIPDQVVEHGSLKQLQHECGFDVEAIYAAAKKLYSQRETLNKR